VEFLGKCSRALPRGVLLTETPVVRLSLRPYVRDIIERRTSLEVNRNLVDDNGCEWNGMSVLRPPESENLMNENFESTVESVRKVVPTFGAPAKEKLLAQVREEPAKTLSIVLAGSVVLSVLLGYCISRMEKNSKQERLVENWMREVTNWIGQHGRKIAVPIKEGLEATRAAVEEAADSSASAGRQLKPFFKKQKRSFLNLF
jgi:hypothetical protein